MDPTSTTAAATDSWFTLLPLPSLHPIDHVLALVIVAFWPLFNRHEFRQLLIRLRDCPPHKAEQLRLGEYRATIAQLCFAGGVTLLAWFLLSRSASLLGLTRFDWRGVPTGVALSLAGLVVFATGLSWLQVRSTSKEVALDPAKLGPAIELLPRTDAEKRWFTGVSLAAGVHEEVIFRGWALAYVLSLIGAWSGFAGGWATVVAIAVSSAAFGWLHVYQGGRNIVTTGLVGAYLAIIYALSGWLWLVILVHFLIDVFQGFTLGTLLDRNCGEVPEQALGSPGAA